jgi:hypothetical protein
MLRFAMRHGLVRLIGGRAVPLMLVWDVAVLANKARRIPMVDRTLRKGAGAAVRGAGVVVASPRWRTRPGRAGLLRRRPDQPARTRARLVEWHPPDTDRDA